MLDALAALVRALLYAGLLSCTGAVFSAATLRAPQLASGAALVARRGAAITIAASLASALLLALRLGGLLDTTTLSAVFNSGFGAATGLQLAGAALLLASPRDETAHGMRLGNAALITLSFAFTGHAAAMDLADGFVAFAHVTAAAWWIGSLWLLRDVCPHQDTNTVALIVKRFGAIAAYAVGALVILGLVLIFILEADEAFRFGSYEQLLAVKLFFVAAVIGVASYNRLRLTPRLLYGDRQAAISLRRMIDVELLLIGLVLATTAILTTYTSPHD